MDHPWRRHSAVIFPKKAFFLSAVLLVAGTLSARAHPQLQDAMWIQFEPALARVAVNVSLHELSLERGFPLKEKTSADRLDKEAVDNEGYILEHLQLAIGSTPLAGRVVRIISPSSITEPEQTFYQYELEYAYHGPPPGVVSVFQSMLHEIPYAAGMPWNISYSIRSKSYAAHEATSRLLPPQELLLIPTELPEATQPVSAPSSSGNLQTLAAYIRHGVIHILTGYDHLLFLAALVIATAGFWEMVKVIVAFTIAHSITLTLCAFGIFRLPSSIVEPAISISIIFVAMENFLWPQRAHSWLRLGTAFGFGLIHGLGFAGGLLDAMQGLPDIGIWLALIGFSLGAEIGNQLVALPLYGGLMWVRKNYSQSRQMLLIRYGSLIITIGGLYYLCVAIREQFVG